MTTVATESEALAWLDNKAGIAAITPETEANEDD
jgi:hypothetical protein